MKAKKIVIKSAKVKPWKKLPSHLAVTKIVATKIRYKRIKDLNLQNNEN